FEPPPQRQPVPQPQPVPVPAPPPAPVPVPQPVVESDASVTARIAAQNEHRKQVEDVGRVLNPSAAAERPPSAADGLRTRPTLKTAALEPAYRAFAAGDVRKSDELLSQILAG